LHSGETNQRLGKIPLVIGMPVIVSHNFDVHSGVVNGSIGRLKKVRYQVDQETGERYLRSCIVHLPNIHASPLSQLETGDFPIMEDNV
ncbi:hypothetical protein C8Q76DRAFT_573189, partial [Earliella scabrosa]